MLPSSCNHVNIHRLNIVKRVLVKKVGLKFVPRRNLRREVWEGRAGA